MPVTDEGEEEEMEDNAEEEVLRQLKWENRMLKQRVFELEEKQKGGGSPSIRGEHKPDSGVFKLLKTKNEQLEEQREELRQSVEQLSLWMSTLRLYQEIFENEAAAMVGVNRDGKVVLFNRTAPQMLG